MPPKLRKLSIKWIVVLICIVGSAQYAVAQPPTEPKTQELLNGLKILFWPTPGSPEVLVKLRIHSGSAFDLAGKSGEMALLGDVLFPDPETIEYFSEQMGGKLTVNVNYDSMTITMRGKAEQLDNILEVLRNALLATQLSPEVVARVREARIKMLRDTAISPSVVADRAIALRLFGDFPYGKSSAGSPEDLARVERGDLMLARERFLNSNNATLAIVGGINEPRASRTLKQLFGPWRRSEQIIPSTFQAAKTPDSKILLVSTPSPTAEIRVAVRGLSKTDPDGLISDVLAKIAQNRLQGLTLNPAKTPVFVKNERYTLPGIFILGTSTENGNIATALSLTSKIFESLATTPVSAAELKQAVDAVIVETNGISRNPESAPDRWLDMDTYKLNSDHSVSLLSLTAADIQRVASRLFKDRPVATVVAGEVERLKPILDGKFQFEVLGETSIAPPKPPTKPGPNSNPR